MAGIRFYKMEYEAEIEYLDDVIRGPFGGIIDIKHKNSRMPGYIKKGSREKIKGELLFEETKNGWRGKS